MFIVKSSRVVLVHTGVSLNQAGPANVVTSAVVGAPSGEPGSGGNESSSSGSASSESGIPKPTRLGARIVDFFFDNGKYIFGSILGAIVYYIVRSTVGSSRRGVITKELESATPLSSNEMAALGRANAIPPAVIRSAVERAFGPGGFLNGRGTAAEMSYLLRSEARALLPPDHLLVQFSREQRTPLFSTASSDCADKENPPIVLIGEHALLRAVDTLVMESRERADAMRPLFQQTSCAVDNGTLDAATLLSLYSLLMATRSEPPKPVAPAKDASAPQDPLPDPLVDETRATPSQRFNIVLDICRRAHAHAQAAASDARPSSGDSVSALEMLAVIELLGRARTSW